MQLKKVARSTARHGVLLGLLLLGGCGGLLPGNGPAPSLFTLSPKSTFRPDLPAVTWQLVVEEPVASGGVDTNKIAVEPTPFEVQFYADVRWVERAPRMVQTLLIESFENTGKIVAVGRQSVGLRADYNLKSELRHFAAVYPAGSKTPNAWVRINVKLVGEPRENIIAFRNFEQIVPAKSAAVKDVVEAFDEALGKVLRAMVEWTLAEGARPNG